MFPSPAYHVIPFDIGVELDRFPPLPLPDPLERFLCESPVVHKMSSVFPLGPVRRAVAMISTFFELCLFRVDADCAREGADKFPGFVSEAEFGLVRDVIDMAGGLAAAVPTCTVDATPFLVGRGHESRELELSTGLRQCPHCAHRSMWPTWKELFPEGVEIQRQLPLHVARRGRSHTVFDLELLEPVEYRLTY